MLISIIIPTLNSMRTLEMCLNSIKKQTYNDIEIFIIDSGSIDGTIKIGNEYNVTTVKSSKQSRTYQRNFGVSKANGEFIFLIDSDEVLLPRMVEECVKQVTKNNLDGLFISTIDTGFTYFGRSRSFGDYMNLKFRKGIITPNSQLRFIKKEIYMKIGGQEENMVIGEDVIFSWKVMLLNYKIGKCKYSLFHYGIEGIKNIFYKKFIYGKTLKIFENKAKKYKISIKNEYFHVAIFYIKNFYKVKVNSKYVFGFIIVKFFEIAGLILGKYT